MEPFLFILLIRLKEPRCEQVWKPSKFRLSALTAPREPSSTTRCAVLTSAANYPIRGPSRSTRLIAPSVQLGPSYQSQHHPVYSQPYHGVRSYLPQSSQLELYMAYFPSYRRVVRFDVLPLVS